jgi:putative endonuclease
MFLANDLSIEAKESIVTKRVALGELPALFLQQGFFLLWGRTMFYVYVLPSQTSGKRYVGQTDDLDERVAQHNDPNRSGVLFTSKNPGPWLLVYSEAHTTRSEAMQREKWLKSGVGRDWLLRHLAQSAESAPADRLGFEPTRGSFCFFHGGNANRSTPVDASSAPSRFRFYPVLWAFSARGG